MSPKLEVSSDNQNFVSAASNSSDCPQQTTPAKRLNYMIKRQKCEDEKQDADSDDPFARLTPLNLQLDQMRESKDSSLSESKIQNEDHMGSCEERDDSNDS